jgi:hypothetical protein
MKNTMNFKRMTLIALLGAAVSVTVWAQPGPGMGGGMQQGMGPGMGPGMGAGVGAGMGPGMGPGAGGGRGMRFSQNNTRGWNLMSAEERTEFQRKMREVKTYDECVQTQGEHRAAMEGRAKEKGLTLPTPRRNACETMKARGLIK